MHRVVPTSPAPHASRRHMSSHVGSSDFIKKKKGKKEEKRRKSSFNFFSAFCSAFSLVRAKLVRNRCRCIALIRP